MDRTTDQFLNAKTARTKSAIAPKTSAGTSQGLRLTWMVVVPEAVSMVDVKENSDPRAAA